MFPLNTVTVCKCCCIQRSNPQKMFTFITPAGEPGRLLVPVSGERQCNLPLCLMLVIGFWNPAAEPSTGIFSCEVFLWNNLFFPWQKLLFWLTTNKSLNFHLNIWDCSCNLGLVSRLRPMLLLTLYLVGSSVHGSMVKIFAAQSNRQISERIFVNYMYEHNTWYHGLYTK